MSRFIEKLTLVNGSIGTSLSSTASGSSKDINLPDGNDTLVGLATPATLTNKTITDTTNSVTANSLRTNSGGTITISTSALPVTGQALVADDATTASWTNITIPGKDSTSGTVQTTDSTPTTIEAIPTTDNTVSSVTSTISAIGNETGAGFVIKSTFYQAIGSGSLTKISSDDVLEQIGGGLIGIEVNTNADTTGGNVLIEVTGLAAAMINWKSATTLVTISQ